MGRPQKAWSIERGWARLGAGRHRAGAVQVHTIATHATTPTADGTQLTRPRAQWHTSRRPSPPTHTLRAVPRVGTRGNLVKSQDGSRHCK